jgi:CopG family nickel-responsive transcriptional regulator
MKDSLVRFGVAMEGSLLEEFDALVEDRGGSRSELLRDLVRAEVTRARVSAGANAVAALTLVYDHHVRDLTERLTDFQHALGEKVNSALHVHLDHDHCLEVIVMRGPSDELKRAGGKLLATRGVKHGGMEMIAIDPPASAAKPTTRSSAKVAHTHDHAHDHAHDHGHGHAHEEPRAPGRKGSTRRRRT